MHLDLADGQARLNVDAAVDAARMGIGGPASRASLTLQLDDRPSDGLAEGG
jgi:hypothetical protein